jgi:hypothetical protein
MIFSAFIYLGLYRVFILINFTVSPHIKAHASILENWVKIRLEKANIFHIYSYIGACA